MVYGLYMWVAFKTANKRDQIMSNIETQLAQYQMYEPPTVIPLTLRGSTDPGMAVNCKFINQVDRDAVWTQTISLMGSGAGGPVTKSQGYIWNSTIDEGTNDDVVTDSRSW